MSPQKVILPTHTTEVIEGELFHSNTSDILVIFCHGSISLSEFPEDRKRIGEVFTEEIGVSFFAFDYPKEELKLDQKKRFRRIFHKKRVEYIGDIIKYFKEKYQKIVLEGHSLGALDVAIAIQEYQKDIEKIYLINGVYSLKLLPISFQLLLYSMLILDKKIRDDGFYCIRNFHPKKIHIPTLVIVGEADELIPSKQSLSFFDVLDCPKELIRVQGGDHALIDAKYLPKYVGGVKKWLRGGE